ncbi:MAG: CBS domain-containing protein, partial [Acidobacteriota bacterium]|nr:CBS domain-containing protein [Acidobacteriota bacterium]
MIVESLMTRDVEVCRPDSTLADAAAVMWRRDCGVVPVVEEDGRVVGVVTDRDICMALSMRGQRAAEVRVAEVLTGGVQTCTPVDDVREALETMARRQVRRLPVVDSRGHLVGLLSINDIIRHTRKGKPKKRVSRRAALAALRAICAP